MNRANMVIGIIFLVFGILICIITPFQTKAISSSKYGPAFFPRVTAFIMIICSIGLLIQSVMAMRYGHDDNEKKADVNWQKEKRVAFVFFMLILYVLCIKPIGFLIASAVFGVFLLYVLNARKWWYYTIHICLLVVINYIFTNLLYVHLPSLNLL
jgi:putative tricarboxylic transport membrane protein